MKTEQKTWGITLQPKGLGPDAAIQVRATPQHDGLLIDLGALWLSPAEEETMLGLINCWVSHECAPEWPDTDEGCAILALETARQAVMALEATGQLVFADGWRFIQLEPLGSA